MGKVIQFPVPEDYDGVVCKCGSAWFEAKVVIDKNMNVTGYQYPVVCHECKAEL